MKLVIAEKKDLAEEIVRAIPAERISEKNYIICGDYIICWAAGHLLRHKNPAEIDDKYKNWKLEDLPIYFKKWGKTPIEEKKVLLYTILKLLKDSRITEIIHAGDSDSEGQYLIDEILEYANNKKPVKRLIINDGTIEAVKKAISKIDENEKYINLGKAAQARSIADMIIGFNLSRFYSINNKTRLTVGRVQTPTLALVINRDEEIKKHIKEKYYELYYKFYLKSNMLNSELNLKNILSEKVLNKEEYSWIEKIENRKEKVEITKKKASKENPLPFDLGTLQATAEILYRYSSQKTLDITQALRDKYKAITYNRSEIKYLSDEHYKEAPKLVKFISNKLKIQAEFNFNDKPRCFNTEKLEGNPHHGIIPTMENFEINALSEEEKNIYMLVVERYLIQFLPKIEVEKTEAKLNIEGKFFKQSSTKVINPGYTKYFKEIKDEEGEEEENVLSKLPEGLYDVLIAKENFYIEEKETRPKKHYTEASLLFDMRNIIKYVINPEVKEIFKRKDKGKDGINGSIGTPATQAGIINSLFEKGYLKKIGRNIVATDLAIEYLKILPEELKTADTTALWWIIQEDIESGNAEIENLTLKVLEDVRKILEMKPQYISFKPIEKEKNEYGVCPKCKEGKILSSEKGYYCSKYKDGCKFSVFKKMKIYGQKEIEITEARIKALIAGKSILITKIPNKNGKEYDGYFKLEITDKFNNLVLDKFKK